METNSGSTGILIVGHGTRHERGTAEFNALAALLSQQWPGIPVASCFLELQTPEIAAGLSTLLNQGVREVIVAPLLLFAAGHAKHDIPAEVAAVLQNNPHVRSIQAEPLDCHPEVLKLAEFRLKETVDLQLEDRIIVVARGTSDPEGVAAIERFAAVRQRQLPQHPISVAYVAAAEPRLRPLLIKLANESASRIILQPHLLFEGEVISTVRQVAAEVSMQFPGLSILTIAHLGAGILTQARQTLRLVNAYAERITAAAENLTPESARLLSSQRLPF